MSDEKNPAQTANPQENVPEMEDDSPPRPGVTPDTGSGREAIQELLESKEQEPSLRDLVIDIARRLNYKYITEDEAAVELAVELNEKMVPMTRALLQFVGIKNFTFTTDCDLQRLELLTKKQKQWMSIEVESLPDEGAAFTIDDFGNELRGILIEIERLGFYMLAPDHRAYPLNALALVRLKKRGGAQANVGKPIIAKVTVLNGLHLYVTKVLEPDEMGPEKSSV